MLSPPTLEDHFDKTVLPKAMQVKKFGRAERTKYTHLVDQDTTKLRVHGHKSTASTSSSRLKVEGHNKPSKSCHARSKNLIATPIEPNT